MTASSLFGEPGAAPPVSAGWASPGTPNGKALSRTLLGFAAMLLAAAPADAQGGLWRLNLSAGINYSNNVRLRQAGSQRQPRGLIGSTGAGLNRTFVGADSALDVGVHTKALFFRNLSELNRLSSSGHLGYTRPLSYNTSLNVSDQYTSSYNTLLDDLTNEGVLLPLAGTRRNHAVLDIDHDLSARDRMGMSVRHDVFIFRNDPDFDDSDLIDGWRLRGSLQFNRQFSATKSGSVTFGYTRNGRRVVATDSYTTGLGWAQSLGPRFRFSTDAGVSTARSETRSATRATGSVSVSYQLGQGSVHGSVFRSMGLGVGLGRVTVREGVSAGLNQTLWRKVHVSLSGRQISHGDPFDTVFEYDVQSLSLGVNMKIWKSIGISTGYNWVNRRQGRDLSGLRGGLQASYNTSF